MTAYARGQNDFSRRVVLGGSPSRSPRTSTGASTRRASSSPPVSDRPDGRGPDLARLLARTASGLPTSPQVTEAVGWYDEAAEAVVGALERAGGDLSGGQRRFRSDSRRRA